MKKLFPFSLAFILLIAALFSSCSKDSNSQNESTPSLNFKSGDPYTSSYDTLDIGTSIIVGIIGNSGGSELQHLKITGTINDISQTLKDTSFTSASINLDQVIPLTTAGLLHLQFILTDKAGKTATQELSLWIKNPDNQPPVLILKTDAGYTYSDVSVDVNTVLTFGVLANSEGEKLHNFKIVANINSMLMPLIDSTLSSNSFNCDYSLQLTNPGTIQLTFMVSNSIGLSAEKSVFITVSSKSIQTEHKQLLTGSPRFIRVSPDIE
jgi:hypothetical protein